MISFDPIFDAMAFGCGFSSALWGSTSQVQIAGIALMTVVLALRSWVIVEKYRMIRAVETQRIVAGPAPKTSPWR